MRYFFLATLFFLLACEKETDDNKDISPEVQGQWIRGSFDLSEFWNYAGQLQQLMVLILKMIGLYYNMLYSFQLIRKWDANRKSLC